MADLKTVIGLLYRADWTKLSMSADVYTEYDGELANRRLRAMRPQRPEIPEQEPALHRHARAALLIAPGGRYRLEYLDESAGCIEGNDGEHEWVRRQDDLEPPGWLPLSVGPGGTLQELLCPSDLLSALTLEVRGPVTACGRDAIAVTATPRASSRRGRGWPPRLFDRVDVVVDAELGILLRSEETCDGQRLSLTELAAVVLDPPEAADAARFEPPGGSHFSEPIGESLRQAFGGPGWQTAKDVAGLVAGGLGAWIRFAPHRRDAQEFREAAMPPTEPAAHDPQDRTVPSDDVLCLLQRSGENKAFTATLHEWHDLAAMLARVPDSARAAGHGGLGFLLDSVAGGKSVTHKAARLRASGEDTYRIDDLSHHDANRPTTVGCDGRRRWQAYPAVTLTGPAQPLPHDIAMLVDSSWLLEHRLSGGTEISHLGRRGYQVGVTKGGRGWPMAPLMFFPMDAIVDAERGYLLRLICYAGDRPAQRWELTDLGAGPADSGDFAIPPGARTVEETGNPIADLAAVAPGAAGCAVRTTVDVARRTSDAVSAARSFLDDLRGRNRPG